MGTHQGSDRAPGRLTEYKVLTGGVGVGRTQNYSPLCHAKLVSVQYKGSTARATTRVEMC